MTYCQWKAQFICPYIGARNGIHLMKIKECSRSCSKHHELPPEHKDYKHITMIWKEFYNLQFTNVLLLQNPRQTLYCEEAREGSDFSNNSRMSMDSCRTPQNLKSSSSPSSLPRLEERQLN